MKMSRLSWMRSTGLAVTVSITLLMAPIAGTTSASRLGSSFSAHALGRWADAWQLFRDTNESRERFDLPPLRLNLELSEIARRHSVAMARAGALFHTRTSASTYADRLAHWGENVGYTPGDVGSVQQAFMASPTHREHILNGCVPTGGDRSGACGWHALGDGLLLRLSPSPRDVHCCEGFPAAKILTFVAIQRPYSQ